MMKGEVVGRHHQSWRFRQKDTEVMVVMLPQRNNVVAVLMIGDKRWVIILDGGGVIGYGV